MANDVIWAERRENVAGKMEYEESKALGVGQLDSRTVGQFLVADDMRQWKSFTAFSAFDF